MVALKQRAACTDTTASRNSLQVTRKYDSRRESSIYATIPRPSSYRGISAAWYSLLVDALVAGQHYIVFPQIIWYIIWFISFIAFFAQFFMIRRHMMRITTADLPLPLSGALILLHMYGTLQQRFLIVEHWYLPSRLHYFTKVSGVMGFSDLPSADFLAEPLYKKKSPRAHFDAIALGDIYFLTSMRYLVGQGILAY